MTMTILDKSHCSDCGRLVDAASGANHDFKPKSGDITICLYCGHVMAYDNKLLLRELTKEEMIHIAGDPMILKIQKARSYVMKNKEIKKS